MRVSKVEAQKVLETAATSADELSPDEEWIPLLQALSDMCVDGVPQTHIAFMGTAILAKATEPAVDVFALKTGAGTPGAYSARSIAKDVLAAHAPRLGIHLGVSGREPLNNQPYFKPKRLDVELAEILRSDARPVFRRVIKLLEKLQGASRQEAFRALQAFIRVRRRAPVNYELFDVRTAVLESALARAIGELVNDRSERGKRAQAVTAALLDLATSPDKVGVARIYDPDRRFPGDVVLAPAETDQTWRRSYEVRDKVVTESDLYHFVVKLAARGVTRGGVVAVHRDQPRIDMDVVLRFAQERGIKLSIYYSWDQLLSEILFNADVDPIEMLKAANERILRRMEEMEVSDDGIRLWVRLAGEMEEIGEVESIDDASIDDDEP